MTQTALVLLAHGSRDPLWQQPMQAVARSLRAADPAALVACAFVELCAPDLPTAVAQLQAQGATQIRILPLFLGLGQHAREDLPRLVEAATAQFPELDFRLLPAIGEDPRLIELLAQIGQSALHS